MEKLTTEQAEVLAGDLDDLFDAAFKVRKEVRANQINQDDLVRLNVAAHQLFNLLQVQERNDWDRRMLNAVFGYHNHFQTTITHVYQVKDTGASTFDALAHIKLPNISPDQDAFESDFIIHVDNLYLRSLFHSLVDNKFTPFVIKATCDDFASQSMSYVSLVTAPQFV